MVHFLQRLRVDRPSILFGLASLILLVLALLVSNARATSSARRVALTALVSVENSGDEPASAYYFRLTVPVADHPQQRLVGIDYATEGPVARKRHKNGLDEYLEFAMTVPARSTIRREVTFVLDLAPYDIPAVAARAPENAGGRHFLDPSPLVESDAPEVRAIARELMARHGTPDDRARAAYDYSRTMLTYRNEADNHGAVYALQTGGGDCTEFAAVFAALSRAMGIPARLTAEFLFSRGEGSFGQPNHHAAEAFIGGRWLPVDPNLAVDPSIGYGYGFGGERKVVLRREGAWVWSSWSQTRSADVKAGVRWSLRTLSATEN
jgi:transglutaminase-like putative cysteine protease